jgi:hypothetical protein
MRALGFLGLVLFMGALTVVGAQYLGDAIGNSLNDSAALVAGENR